MREGAKKRLAGAVVLVTLVVIFVPMLLEERPAEAPVLDMSVPEEPAVDERFGVTPPESLVDATAEADAFGTLSDGAPLELPPAEGALDIVAPLEPTGEGATDALAPDDEPPPAPRKPGVMSDPPREPKRRVESTKPAATAERPTPPARQARQAPQEQAPSAEEPQAARQKPPPQPDDGMPSWVVQVASLGTRKAAEGLVTRLQGEGFSAFVEEAEVRGRLFYRVRVGPELERAGAERTAAQLRQQQQLDTLIQRYP